MIETEKFYLFDVGLANYLAQRQPKRGTPEFGKSFEHYILMELMAYKAYRQPDMEISFWRTAAGQEVDFIINNKTTAIEIKSGPVHAPDIRGLNALLEDGPIKNRLVVCTEKEPRCVANDIRIVPWELFLEKLWGDEWV